MSNFDRLQGSAEHCVHSKTVLGCSPCLKRVKRQAGMYLRERDELRTALQDAVDLLQARASEYEGRFRSRHLRNEVRAAERGRQLQAEKDADRLQKLLDTYGGGER